MGTRTASESDSSSRCSASASSSISTSLIFACINQRNGLMVKNITSTQEVTGLSLSRSHSNFFIGLKVLLEDFPPIIRQNDQCNDCLQLEGLHVPILMRRTRNKDETPLKQRQTQSLHFHDFHEDHRPRQTSRKAFLNKPVRLTVSTAMPYKQLFQQMYPPMEISSDYLHRFTEEYIERKCSG